MLVSTAVMCLALNIYHEARGEQIPGQYAVALVTKNRAGHNKNICKTVFAPKQFSWANGRAKKVKDGWVVSTSLKPKDDYAWYKAYRVAQMTLNGRMIDFTGGADHYHANYVRPYWSVSKRPIHKTGRHIFYRLSQR